jgi:hypothetical protein
VSDVFYNALWAQQSAMQQMLGQGYGGVPASQSQQYANDLPKPIPVAVVTPPRYLKETTVKDEILPDISLTRVFKWAVVLLIAMGLGRKVWAMFGTKIEKQLHKALSLGVEE